VTEQSEHLSNAQIENYGIRTSGAGPEAAQRDEHQRVNHQSIDDQSISDQRVEAHLADCTSCRDRLLGFHRSLFSSPTYQPEPDRPTADDPKKDPKNDLPEHDTSLSGHLPSSHSPSGHSSSGHSASGYSAWDQKPADFRLEGANPTDSALADSKFANPKDPVQAQVSTVPTPECPSDDALRQLAAGLTPDDDAPALTRHAATCNHCGPLLRAFTEDFSDDFSPEEQAVLDSLQSASPAWQKKTARKMLRESTTLVVRDSSSKFTNWSAWKWVPVFSFLLLLAAGATWVYPLLILHKASLAVEAEYRKGRPMKYRPAGVPYGRYKRELGGGGIVPVSAPIIEVPKPEGSPLLASNADLLRGDTSRAKSTLEKALDKEKSLGKERPLLLNNLAVAYAMEAEDLRPVSEQDKEAQKKVYQKALDITGKILLGNPSDPAALFNQALILERLGNTKDAITALEQLRRVEQDAEWREEATEELRRIQPTR
jgi:hypothetical protein